MSPTSNVLLEFDPAAASLGNGKPLSDGLSVAAQLGKTLWVANDETLSLERLTLAPGAGLAARALGHVSFPLADYLDLPVPPSTDPDKREEADLEGLAYVDGVLWLTGSHSLKRKTPRPGDGPEKARKQLARIGNDGNRFLLARIPVVEEHGTWHPVRQSAASFAARLDGDGRGDSLTEALAGDEHLAPFLGIPGKDNGFDIEGLAVAGERIFLGLRGPVLRGWAVILELEPHARAPSTLELKPIDAGRPYLKHFLHLGGLGIRDLCRHDDGLLILAGPTMDLDGPVHVLRWPGGAKKHKKGELIPATGLQTVLDIPYGQGVDHAEGMTLFSSERNEKPALLVVYDAASERRKRGEHGVLADIFPLPAN